jgi:hypothetical protein
VAFKAFSVTWSPAVLEPAATKASAAHDPRPRNLTDASRYTYHFLGAMGWRVEGWCSARIWLRSTCRKRGHCWCWSSPTLCDPDGYSLGECSGAARMIDSAWREYRGWARFSMEEQARARFWGWVILGLTCFCAVLAASASYFDPDKGAGGVAAGSNWIGRTLSFASAAAAAVAGAIGAARLRADHERVWITARGIAEAIKSECFLRAAGAGEYTDAGADDIFQRRLAAITARGDGIAALFEPVLANKDPRCPPIPISPGWYRTNRLLEQYTWYAHSGRRENDAAERFKYLALTLSAFAALLGVLAGVWPALRAELWIGVVTTVSAALTTYAMIDRRKQMALGYAQTATKLNRLDARFDGAVSDLLLSQLVADAEDTILGENRAWSDIMTRARPPTGAPSPASEASARLNQEKLG